MKIFLALLKCKEILLSIKFKRLLATKFTRPWTFQKEEAKIMNLMKSQDYLKLDGPKKNMSQQKELKKKLLKSNAMIF